jgi:hypothetical protein
MAAILACVCMKVSGQPYGRTALFPRKQPLLLMKYALWAPELVCTLCSFRQKTKPRFLSSSGLTVAEICGRTVQPLFVIKLHTYHISRRRFVLVFGCNSEQHRANRLGCFVSVGPFRPHFLIFWTNRFKILPPYE